MPCQHGSFKEVGIVAHHAYLVIHRGLSKVSGLCGHSGRLKQVARPTWSLEEIGVGHQAYKVGAGPQAYKVGIGHQAYLVIHVWLHHPPGLC